MGVGIVATAVQWGQTGREANAVPPVMPTAPIYPEFDIRRYGGDPTGVAPSDTALAQVLAVCGSTGGTVRWPAGNYLLNNPLSFLNRNSIIFQGDGSAGASGAQTATRINYAGGMGTTGVFMDWNSARGCWLRDLQVIHTSASFPGTYLQCGNSAGRDALKNGVENCTFGSGAQLAGLILDLNNTTEFVARNCNFLYTQYSIQGARSASAYSNCVHVDGCEFAWNTSAPIQGGGASWVIDGACNFEGVGAQQAAPGAILSVGGAQWVGLVVSGNWFGDAPTGIGTWIDIQGQGCVIQGNNIQGGTNVLNLQAGCTGDVILGNFVGGAGNGIIFAGTSPPIQDIVVLGNVFNNVTTPWVNPANIAAGKLVFGGNYGMGIPAGHAAYNFWT